MLNPVNQLVRLGRALAEWPVGSQQQARRNAMVALTECASRRSDRQEVEEFFAGRTAPAEAPVDADPDAIANA